MEKKDKVFFIYNSSIFTKEDWEMEKLTGENQ